MPKKPSGEIGITKISGNGLTTCAQLLPVQLPETKEELELYFAERFLTQFNHEARVEKVSIVSQNDTSDLDFVISGSSANFLELAEISPYGKPFVTEVSDGYWVKVYDFSKWIWEEIISKKSDKYGKLSNDVILLLYGTNWKHYVCQEVLHSLIWTLRNKGCRFHSVFLLQSAGSSQDLLYKLFPSDQSADPARKFRDTKYLNYRPGVNSWNLNPDEK